MPQTNNKPALLTLRHCSESCEIETVDGRTIRHLSVDDYTGDGDVLLIDGQGRAYLAAEADWDRVKHLSLYR